ncbi:MAG: phosphoglycerate mutase (2,3-diphosphoglycerate-independent) [Candidatus Bathyarchaeia archaeon]
MKNALGKLAAKRMAEAVQELYTRGETDYWLPPLILYLHGEPIGRVRPGDALIFCCRRGEREIQLTRAFTDPNFCEFPREKLDPLFFVPLTLYHPSLRYLKAAFAPQNIPKTLGEVLANQSLSQIRIAEEEKFAHVTYFLNGGRADPFPGEKDVCVPSSLKRPIQVLPGLLEKVREELNQHDYHLVVVNLATGDIVGHWSELEPKVECAEAVDKTLGRLLEIAARKGYWTVITADHGLLEDHGPPGGPPNVSHTLNPVPLVVISPHGTQSPLLPTGRLADVAPTILQLLNIPLPLEMTGQALLRQQPSEAIEKVMLIILDGWGLGQPGRVNPIELAKTVIWKDISTGPMAKLEAAGEGVGLPPGTKGNSEAGHLNIGSGRVVLQDEVRIKQAIDHGEFAKNPIFHEALAFARQTKGALHLLGLLSKQSSHGSVDYIYELLKLAKHENFEPVYVHLITDGRSTEPGSAPALLEEFGQALGELEVGIVVTALGRGLALDRGGDYWGKTQRAYRALVYGEGIAVPI